MTIKIEIEVPSDLVLKGAGSEYLDRAAAALGFYRTPAIGAQHREALSSATALSPVETTQPAPANISEALDAMDATLAGGETDAPIVTGVVKTSLGAGAPALDTRAVGSASEGKARRTKDQIAEDGEFEKLAAEKGVPLDKLNKVIGEVGRSYARGALETMDVADKQVDEPQAAISTGEERIGPEDEQDAADEAAETEKSGLAPIDVLRRLLGDYQKAHGMPAAVKLCQEGGLIGAPIHDLDEAGIEKAIAALSVSPLSLDAKAEPKPVETVAPKSKADLIEAMMRYGDKFDGTREQAKMTNTLADCPRIFMNVFGDAVTKLSQVPEDGYGRAVAAIEQAIASDPFGRAK